MYNHVHTNFGLAFIGEFKKKISSCLYVLHHRRNRPQGLEIAQHDALPNQSQTHVTTHHLLTRSFDLIEMISTLEMATMDEFCG